MPAEELELKAAEAVELLREAQAALAEELEDGKSLEMMHGDGGPVDSEYPEQELEVETPEDGGLSVRQQAQARSYGLIAENFGAWDQSAGEDGAHYLDGQDNPFAHGGIMCRNCVFYSDQTNEGSPDDTSWGSCQIVEGSIDPEGLCKLWVIPEDQLSGEVDGPESGY